MNVSQRPSQPQTRPLMPGRNKEKEPSRKEKKQQKMAEKAAAKELGIKLPKTPKAQKKPKSPKPQTPKLEGYARRLLDSGRLSAADISAIYANRPYDVSETEIAVKHFMPILGDQPWDKEWRAKLETYGIHPETSIYDIKLAAPASKGDYDFCIGYPTETISFKHEGKTTAAIKKMAEFAGYGLIVAKIDKPTDDGYAPGGFRLFVYSKNAEPVLKYCSPQEAGNPLDIASVRMPAATLTIDLIPDSGEKTKMYVSARDGERYGISSHFVDGEAATSQLPGGMLYSCLCALTFAREGRLGEVAMKYFHGDFVSMFLPGTI